VTHAATPLHTTTGLSPSTTRWRTQRQAPLTKRASPSLSMRWARLRLSCELARSPPRTCQATPSPSSGLRDSTASGSAPPTQRPGCISTAGLVTTATSSGTPLLTTRRASAPARSTTRSTTYVLRPIAIESCARRTPRPTTTCTPDGSVQPGRARSAYLQEARRLAPRPLAHTAARTRARTFQRQSIRDVAEADVCMKFAVQLGLIPHDQDSEYRNFQTLCMNPPAFAESDEYQALVCGGLRHALMSGHAAARVSHGAHATRYTPRSCGTLYRIHWAAARKRRAEARANGRRRQGTAHPAPLSGPPTPGRAIPLSCGSADSALVGTQPVAARGAADSAFGSTQTAAAHTVHSSTLARGVWRRSDASHALGTAAMKTAVYVVQRASGLLHVGLTADSSIASGFIDVPYSAEGRREVRAAASRLVTEYGPNHSTSTFYRGRRVPVRRPPTVRCRGNHGRTC